FYGYFLVSFLSGCSDEAVESTRGNQEFSLAPVWNIGGLTPSYNPLAITGGPGQGVDKDQYAAFWTGIKDANVFLANIDGAAIVTNSKNKSRFKAEAQMLRAFYYLELIKQFGPMPIIDSSFESTFDFKTLTRPGFQEVVDFIVHDCDSAIANPDLPLRLVIDAERGRFSKAVAYAIKSEALLYNASPLWNPTDDAGKWQAAAAASKTALAALTEGGQFALASDYGNYFMNQSDISASPADRETIYEILARGGEHDLINFNDIPSKLCYKSGTNPSQELVDNYDMQATGEPPISGYSDAEHLHPIINTASGYDENDPYSGRDPRFYATVWYNNAVYDNINGEIRPLEIYAGGREELKKIPPNRINTQTGYYLRKFRDPKLQVGQDANARWKKYHLSEIYLNYAEAENEASGPVAEVYDAINTVRRRASMPNLPSALTKEQMRERIRRERQVELAIEEHRFWDVRRWKILDQTDKVVTGMEPVKGPGNTFTYKRFVADSRSAWQDKYRIFPIPIGEVSNIPDFDLNQNPGW
ncbi:MAG TPA: RagB/SusD family nutrient uptake outer membrane protein, partial [Flavitalea sp.]|nr:RagB/SusD family nutrient uptake outer membrane protein [Flavitalea sp.]